MQVVEMVPGVFAVDREGAASNVGLVKTEEGVVVVDTTSNEEEMAAVLAAADVKAEDVGLVILTHADGDHTGGLALFDCPVTAHMDSVRRMKNGGEKSQALAKKIDETFEGEITVEFGGMWFKLRHLGGHKSDACVVWMPDEKVLFPGDLVFEGRYPYMLQSDVEKWLEALDVVTIYPAKAMLPGHGTLCGYAEVMKMRDYIAETWERTQGHAAQGHSLEETLADPDYPKHAEWIRENLYETNIEFMYGLLKGES